MATTETDYLESRTLKEILNVSDGAMDQAMGIAYQLYLTGHFVAAETVCRGLIACDHRYWWPHTLHASVLRRLGRLEEALTAVEQGLKYEARQPKLLLMRAELVATLARRSGTPPSLSVGSDGVDVSGRPDSQAQSTGGASSHGL
jgi:hypothetical protein